MEEAEKYYIIRGLKENRAIELQLRSCNNIEELKKKMKLLDIQEKSKGNEIIYPKYPVTRIPHHTNQFVRRQHYGGWNWRNDQSQHPDAITGSRYNVYSPKFLSPSYHHPSFSLQRPILYRNQRFPQRPTVLRPNAPTFNPRQRTQNNNTVFQPHQTGELMIIQGRINFKQVDVLLDTGSSVNSIPKNIISQIKGSHNVEYIKTKLATINGEIEHHIPEKILSDRNTAFTSSKFKHFLKHNNIIQLLTTSHRPQTNGKVERINQTIITRLKCESSNSSNKVPWTKILEKVTHQYNQTPQTITGFPPTYLMYGNLPFEISLKDNEIYPPLEEARKLAKERTEQYYKINKIRYDKKFQEADFKVGDLVMYEEFQYPNTKKLSHPYSGPYTVLRKCSDVLFEIDRPNALNKTDTELVRLRHFHPSENFQLNYIQQNTHNNEKKIIIKRNILRNTEITEFCLTRLFDEKE
ncbi:retrotransposable element Tf2 protein type 3 [Trichonephila clavipes]|nr:retrotransposable element Tf2 protein type 3 [Trichonephila clavipes]